MAMRRAEAHGLDVDAALPRLITAREITSSEDVAAVLHHRMEAWTAVATRDQAPHRQPRHIAGLIPAVTPSADPGLARALAEREQLITARASVVLEEALTAGHSWAVPPEGRDTPQWRAGMLTVAAYRDKHAITDPNRPLGGPPGADLTRRAERARAARVLHRASGDGAQRADAAYATEEDCGLNGVSGPRR